MLRWKPASRRVVCTPLSHWFDQRKGGEIAFEQVGVEQKENEKSKKNELGYRRVRLAHAVSSDIQADTLDQHIKAAVELFRRYIPPIFEAITVEFFKKTQIITHIRIHNYGSGFYAKGLGFMVEG